MTHGDLRARAKALEEVFFAGVDQKLLDQMQARLAADRSKTMLAAASGITDDTLLEQLIAQGVKAETLAALSFVPLVAVAWADGKVEDREREAVLEAAEQQGIDKDGPGFALLRSWLAATPLPEMLDVWKSYIKELTRELGSDATATLKVAVMERAEKVATAAGGILGLGTISSAEQKMLNELAATFG